MVLDFVSIENPSIAYASHVLRLTSIHNPSTNVAHLLLSTAAHCHSTLSCTSSRSFWTSPVPRCYSLSIPPYWVRCSIRTLVFKLNRLGPDPLLIQRGVPAMLINWTTDGSQVTYQGKLRIKVGYVSRRPLGVALQSNQSWTEPFHHGCTNSRRDADPCAFSDKSTRSPTASTASFAWNAGNAYHAGRTSSARRQGEGLATTALWDERRPTSTTAGTSS